MTDYEKGFEAGKAEMRRLITADPSILFELTPDIAKAVSEKISASSLTDAQKAIANKAMNGELSYTDIFKALQNPSKWLQE